MSLSHTLHTLASDVYHCLSSWTDGKPYHYVNWWNDSEEFWIADFITHHFLEHPAVTFFSCLEGRRRRFARFYRGRKIFFSGENLQEGGIQDERQGFRDHRIDEVDLAIGFELRQEAKYYRFPLWVCYFFSPSDTLEEIRAKIAAFNDPQLRLSAGRTHFASLVASHDPSGMRADLLELLNPIAPVDSAGRFRKNTDALQAEFEDNKLKFLSRYRFNLCPENSYGSGYTTEKVFESIAAGCIPIYWGEYLEPGILNPEAILRYERGQEQALYERVQELWTDQAAYERFAQIPPFVDGAAECIWEFYEGLRAQLARILV